MSLNNMATCGHPGCTARAATNGVRGSEKPEFCSRHARDGTINICKKACEHEECMAQRSFGVEGSKKREFCSRQPNR